MRKETQRNLIKVTGIILIGLTVIMFLNFAIQANSQAQDWVKKLDFAKTLTWGQPQNATIEYGSFQYGQKGEWYQTKVFITFENEPWKDYSGMLWFTMNGETHFERE